MKTNRFSLLLFTLLFFTVVGCQDERKNQDSIKPTKSGSARIGSNNPTVESELLWMEDYYEIVFTDQEVQAIDNQPDPMSIVNRIKNALAQFGFRTVAWYEQNMTQYNDGMASITMAEKATLASTAYGYRIALILYVYNAYDATKSTKNKYGLDASQCGFCQGNAFKHAYFRVLDAYTFGYSVSEQLGNDHEGTASGPQADMDKYNNARGIEVYNMYWNIPFSASDWYDELVYRMNYGNLRYLRYENGILTPTNGYN